MLGDTEGTGLENHRGLTILHCRKYQRIRIKKKASYPGNELFLSTYEDSHNSQLYPHL